MYDKIINPNTGRYVKTSSKLGKQILNNYIKVGGSNKSEVKCNCCKDIINDLQLKIQTNSKELDSLRKGIQQMAVVLQKEVADGRMARLKLLNHNVSY